MKKDRSGREPTSSRDLDPNLQRFRLGRIFQQPGKELPACQPTTTLKLPRRCKWKLPDLQAKGLRCGCSYLPLLAKSCCPENRTQAIPDAVPKHGKTCAVHGSSALRSALLSRNSEMLWTLSVAPYLPLCHHLSLSLFLSLGRFAPRQAQPTLCEPVLTMFCFGPFLSLHHLAQGR